MVELDTASELPARRQPRIWGDAPRASTQPPLSCDPRLNRAAKGTVQNARHSNNSSAPLDGSGVLQRLLPAAERRNFIAWGREPQGRCRSERTTNSLDLSPQPGTTDEREPNEGSIVIRHRWEHHGVSGLGGLGSFDCSCWRASFQGNHQYHAHRRRAFFVEAKVAVGKNKASKATAAIVNWKGRVQRKVLVDQVHVSGALSGACTGKGPQMANPRPTPNPGNHGPPWPPGTSGDPAGYSRGRPLGGSRLSLVRSGSPGADAARL